MLKKIRVNNFRCLQNNLEVTFEDDLTVIVGENDSGKTSIIDAIKIAFHQKEVDLGDFSYGTNEIEIELEIDDLVHIIKYTLDESGQINSKRFMCFSRERLNQYKEKIEEIVDDNRYNELKEIAHLFGVSYRSNTRFDTLKNNLIDQIKRYLSNEDDPILVETKIIPSSNLYSLDGKDFEDISFFIKKLFFDDLRKKIWQEPVNENETIESFMRNKLNSYEVEINNIVNQGNINQKIKEFLPSLTKIAISTELKLQDINIDVKVKFLENDKEILVNKKGDGTKRRITMALLDYKAEVESSKENEGSIFLLDEPDTHLHVKAQKELMDIIQKFNKTGKQVIIATHSPFIINFCKPQQIRLLTNRDNTSSVKFIKKDEQIDELLRNIGIENIYLFFARKILLVEGQTEEKFIPIIFERLFGLKLYSNLVKIINVTGVTNVPGFARALLELVDKNDIFILVDNDIQEETIKLMNQLDLNEENIFRIGNKEFEDSFKANTIYTCWKKYVKEKGKRIGDMWTEENIKKLQDQCISDGEKFSEKIRELNSGCIIKLDKISLGIALGSYCEKDELDENLKKLLYKLKD